MKFKRSAVISFIILLLSVGSVFYLYRIRVIDFRLSRRGWHMLTDIEYIQSADGKLERMGRFMQVGPFIVVCYYH
jgi:hypothetical protein